MARARIGGKHGLARKAPAAVILTNGSLALVVPCDEPRNRRRALPEGIVTNPSAAAAARIATASGHLPIRAGLMAAAIAGANTVLCLLGSRRGH